MRKTRDRRLQVLLLCYGVVLLYLLFLCRLPGRAFAGSVNLMPGRTLRTYGRAAWFGLQAHRPALLRYAAGNLAGNLALFFPAGLLLPARFPGLQRFWRFFGVLAGAVALVEALQWATGLGACDIDDWLINLPSGLCGFALWRRFFGKTSV